MTISITTDQTSPVVAATAGEEWIVDTGVTIATDGVAIDASGSAAGRQFLIKGHLVSTNGPAFRLGSTELADSGTSIKIDIDASITSGGKGLVATSGGLTFINIGEITTTGTAITLLGNANSIENSGLLVSTDASAIISHGRRDSINNNDVIRAVGDGLVATGDRASLTNNLTLVSSAGSGIDASGDRAIISNFGLLRAADDGIASKGDHATITNTDRVIAGEVAIRSSGANATITNETRLDGADFGLFSTGNQATITNHGTIQSDGVALRSTGKDAIITSMALLSGDVALESAGNGATITNNHIIKGLSKQDAAIRITASGETSLTNTAEIQARSGHAIEAGQGAEHITNTGTIRGSVSLGRGDDWFASLSGKVTGSVAGGRGDDIYETGIALKVVERAGQGIDTVQSHISWTLGANIENLELEGSRAIDATGNRLANRISGNDADNRLTGAGAADTFVFSTHAGSDTISDFGRGADRLDFADVAGIDSFRDLAGHIEEIAKGLVIDLTDTKADLQILLVGVSSDELTARDFLF